MEKRLWRIFVSGVLLAAAMLLESRAPVPVVYVLFGVSYALIGWDVLWRAVQNIFHGQVFDENFLMALATVGACCVGELEEAVGVMLFYQVGEFFQSYAVGKSRRSIAELMDIRPDYANVRRDGALCTVDPGEVAVGETIVVKAGEKVPLDGVILEGSSMIDTRALTGESVPRSVHPGDTLLSGCINESGLLTVEVTKEFGESTVSKILDLVENAGSKKSKTENFITRFAAVYTPVVVIAAVLLAVIPPLVVPGAAWSDWIYRALNFLVVSCPCALVISIPLSFFGGIGGASRAGILVKGSSYLEALANTEIAVFDKTGTLTRGVFDVQEVAAQDGFTREQLLSLAARAETYSTHPIAASLRRACLEAEGAEIGEVEELSGRGVRAQVDGAQVCVGNQRLMAELGLSPETPAEPGTVIYIAVDGQYAGFIRIADQLKADAKDCIARLKALGVRETVMLTGDNAAVGEATARALGMDRVYTQLLPGDKVEKVEALLGELSERGKLAFVGDGINDAPVLARADIGVAMGALGSDAAIEAADVVIMTDEPSKIAEAMRIAKKTLRIVRENIVFALGVKAVVLILSAVGLSSMWAAVFADVGVAFLAILNAMRALRGVTAPKASGSGAPAAAAPAV